MILHTILVRPYVFVFLIVFLFLSMRSRGGLLTFLFLATGYLIAWASEASSIRTGFPYGWYSYVYENLQGEWMNWGVPVWDSLSYTFLCFAGLSLAEFVMLHPDIADLRSGLIYRMKRRHVVAQLPKLDLLKLTLLSAAFVVLLDIIIDPLAHQGDKWFLGHIYFYPNPGIYFDVPISNFLGWFLVSFLIVGVNLAAERLLIRPPGVAMGLLQARPNRLIEFADHYGGLLLYFGIFAFNWAITLWIRDWTLAAVDLAWIAIPAFFAFKSLRSSESA